jgi:hypothetical protein
MANHIRGNTIRVLQNSAPIEEKSSIAGMHFPFSTINTAWHHIHANWINYQRLFHKPPAKVTRL